VAPDQPQALHLLGMAALQKAIRARRWSCCAGPSGAILTSRWRRTTSVVRWRCRVRWPKQPPVTSQAIAQAPDFAEAHNNLGNLLQMTGALEEAVAAIALAVGLRPAYAEAFRNLGSALRRLGRLDEAVTALRTALEIDPAFTAAISNWRTC